MGLFDIFLAALNETPDKPKTASTKKPSSSGTRPIAQRTNPRTVIQSTARESDEELRKQQEDLMWQQKEEDELWDEYWLEREDDVPENLEERMMELVTSMETPGFQVSNNNQEEQNEISSMDEQNVSENEEERGIDNSHLSDNLSLRENCFAIRLNDGRNWFEQKHNSLGKSEKELYDRYPLFKRIEAEDRLPMIINSAFPDGMQRKLFIRKLSFNDNDRADASASLGIRPEMQPGNRLFDIIGEGNSLLFIGHISGRVFVVDRIMDAANTECLPYEIECLAIAYADSSRVEHEDFKFLYDIREKAESLTEYTRDRLAEWKEYLRWREEIVKKQIKGCKYFKITVDEIKAQLIFHLVFDSREHFGKFRKYLYRDIQAFSNDYSKNEWHFEFAYDENSRGHRRYYRSVGLGRFRGIRNEYPIQTGLVSKGDTGSKEEDDEAFGAFGSLTAEDKGSVRADDINYYPDDGYEDDFDEDGTEDGSVSESTILQEYQTPYIVEAAYDISPEDSDRMRNLEDEEIVPYIYRKILPRYEKQGFLALSAVGQFSVIGRQERAVQQLESGESYSPNLGAWIFNIRQARLPATTRFSVSKWLNPEIASNEGQRKAVEGMLCAEDVCLVQGPPGTGKTTVIAEAVYQMVSQGKRVLIASQSNDAVDNALERLADTPEIRAIRMGQAARRKRKGEDFVEGKFSEENSLNNYYHALSEKLRETWLNPWDEIQAHAQQYEYDLRELYLYSQDIENFRRQRQDCQDHIRSLQAEANKVREELRQAKAFNNEKMAESQYFERFKENLNQDDMDFSFSLSAAQLRIIDECVASAVKAAEDKGIVILSHGLNADQLGIDGANNSLAFSFHQISQIKGICAKLSAIKKSDAAHDVEADLLRAQIYHLQELINEETDEEKAFAYLRDLKKKQAELKKFGQEHSKLTLTKPERDLFDQRFLTLLESEKKEEAEQALNEVLIAWQHGISRSFEQIENYLSTKNVIDTTPIETRLRKLEGQSILAGKELEQARLDLAQKQQQVAETARKYGIKTDDPIEIEQHIAQLRDDNTHRAQQHSQMREDWEDTIRKFSSRLVNEELFPYDSEFYLHTYINSCNVVGTSCTDRVLVGSDLEDFDVVIIDEVSKVTPPELLLPLMKARKAILVGDHRQLPPMFEEHERSYSEIIESEDLPDELKSLLTMVNFKRFKKMVTASLFKDMFESADNSIKYSLLTQYRMHKDIMDIINRFYDNRLERGLSDEQQAAQKEHGLTIKGIDSGNLIVPDSHAYWFDSSELPSGKPVYDSFFYSKNNNRSTSAFNALEYYMILELLKKLDQANKEAGGEKKTVGVISFYQRQINELRNAVKGMRKQLSSLDIDINTVDRFQGKEKQIIITSLVRNNPQARAGEHVVAFERINVAFSRAQELLVIVGARHMYENLPVQLPNMTDKGTSTVAVYKNIINLLERKASFKTTSKLLNPDMEKMILQKCQQDGDG